MDYLHQKILGWKTIESECKELSELAELALKEEEQGLVAEIYKRKNQLEKDFQKAENLLFLSGDYDSYNAILTIHSGSGGVEACDWAEMLMNMYLQFAKANNFRVTLIDKVSQKEAGIKNAILEMDGLFAYGFLRAERGVHRLVRLSPFDADHARHTSFALVEVVPEIQKDIDIEIKPEELKIETFRSSGPGGQHANVTASAVRIIHLPTKTSASSQNNRSQIKNKEMALTVLKSRLLEKKIEKQEKKINKIRGQNVEASWGNQIRSYVLHPYHMVKDHRTNFETSDTDKVLSGDILPFIQAFLEWQRKKK